MPPCSSTAARATSLARAVMCALAIAAARGASSGIRSQACAAYQNSPRAGSICGGHVGELVLHGLELRDRGAELLARLRVLGGHANELPGRAERVGGEQHERGVAHARGGARRSPSGSAGAASNESSPIGRVRSTPRSSSARIPAAPRSTTANRPPRVPTTTRSASAACGTWRFAPLQRARFDARAPRLGIPGRRRAPRTPPSRSPRPTRGRGSQRARCSSLPPRAGSRDDASACPRIGPGTAPAPITSTRARDRAARAPRRRSASGTASPATPISARPFQSAGSWPAPASKSSRRRGGGHSRARIRARSPAAAAALRRARSARTAISKHLD